VRILEKAGDDSRAESSPLRLHGGLFRYTSASVDLGLAEVIEQAKPSRTSRSSKASCVMVPVVVKVTWYDGSRLVADGMPPRARAWERTWTPHSKWWRFLESLLGLSIVEYEEPLNEWPQA
jgi:hypothetical protein